MRFFFLADVRKLPDAPVECVPLFEDNYDNVKGGCLVADDCGEAGVARLVAAGAVELTRDVYTAMAKAALAVQP